MLLGLWLFFGTLLFLSGMLAKAVHADTVDLSLARIVLIGEVIEHDSYVTPPRVQGRMSLQTDDENVITGIQFDAWWRGTDELLVSDRVAVLDYIGNGAQYEVYSLWTNDSYFLTFLRRAPSDEAFDPAVILMVELDNDSVAYLDYRYD